MLTSAPSSWSIDRQYLPHRQSRRLAVASPRGPHRIPETGTFTVWVTTCAPARRRPFDRSWSACCHDSRPSPHLPGKPVNRPQLVARACGVDRVLSRDRLLPAMSVGATLLHDRSWVLHPMFLSLGFVSCGFLSCCILVVFFERPLFFGQRDPSPAQSIEGEAYARAFEHGATAEAPHTTRLDRRRSEARKPPYRPSWRYRGAFQGNPAHRLDNSTAPDWIVGRQCWIGWLGTCRNDRR